HRALGRRPHHLRGRVLRVAVDPAGGTPGRRDRRAEGRGRRSDRADPTARVDRAVTGRRARSRRRRGRRRRRDPARSRRGAVTRGRFVVFEGGDGSGKSTQAARLAAWLRARGVVVVETHEPGAGPTGAVLRELLLHGPEAITPAAEALLMAADRA